MMKLTARGATLAVLLVAAGANSLPAQEAAPRGPDLPGLTRIDTQIPIRGSAAEIWALLTTPEGLQKWIAPEALVELELGGAYELYFFPDSTDRGMEGTRILSFVPEEMLSYTGEIERTWVVWRLEPESDGTVVLRFTGLGYGETWAERSVYFEDAMPGLLRKIQDAVEAGS